MMKKLLCCCLVFMGVFFCNNIYVDASVWGKTYNLGRVAQEGVDTSTADDEEDITDEDTSSYSLDCNDVNLLKIIYLVRILLNIAFIVLPIGAIIMLTLDLAKNVISGKEDESKKNLNIFIRRIIALAVVFFVYFIVNVVMTFLADSGVINEDDSNNWLTCWDRADPNDPYDVILYNE